MHEYREACFYTECDSDLQKRRLEDMSPTRRFRKSESHVHLCHKTYAETRNSAALLRKLHQKQY